MAKPIPTYEQFQALYHSNRPLIDQIIANDNRNSNINNNSSNNHEAKELQQPLTSLFSNLRLINSAEWQKKHLSDNFGRQYLVSGFFKCKVPLLYENEISF